MVIILNMKTDIITPIEQKDSYWIKRDDTYNIANAWGGKARSCWELSKKATKGLVTAGSRHSPQINIVAHIAKELKLPFNAHTPQGPLGEELTQAQSLGAKIIQHKAGYNTVIIARAKQDALENDYTYIPFGMECWEAVKQTANQVQNIPVGVKRIVISIGSGMSFCGVLQGLQDGNYDIPILGVIVGANPLKRIAKYAPKDWADRSTLVTSKHKYQHHINKFFFDVLLDPIYEAKCYEYLKEGDLLWSVGIRTTKKEIKL
jgi:1-aminocyclopropane-1-carboxylate deaminase/D-cysteine desulfhydrase-like pyridoxal-dependent ACC family enzyme